MSDLTDFLFPKATEQQAKDGVSNSVLMTPLRVSDSFSSRCTYDEFTSSGVWTKNPNARFVAFHIVAGGGGGGGNSSSSGGCGGQGLFYILLSEELASTETVIVGSGGPPSTPGGDSSFAGFVAKGGFSDPSSNLKLSHGSIVTNSSLVQGLTSSRGIFESFGAVQDAGNSIYGGGGGTRLGLAGRSVFAGNGGGVGQNGSFPGGGGGANPSGGGGAGAGANGVVRVWQW